MYNIYADGVCIYSDVFALEATKALSPKLVLEDCSAGSLSITLPQKNAGYNTVERLKTDITVEKDGQEIWMGRVLSENKDFWNNRILYCEGQLAFFNDSTQPPKKYSGYTVRGYLEALVDIHNSKVPENRQIQLGIVTVSDESTPDYFTNFEKTIASLNALIERYGGHMRIRREGGVGYLDYLEEYPNTCTQTIQMGINLLDFTKVWDMSEFATVIVPLGTRLEESAIEELDSYLTVKSVNNDSPYVQSIEAVAAYGWVEKTVSWDDETDPEELLRKAREYLSELQFDDMQLELSALDMHYLNVDIEAVKLLDEIRVVSYPHGLDRLFPVTKLEIPLDSPEKTQFKLGDTIKTSLTSVNDQKNTEILDKIEKLPKAHNILREAKENATAIMHMATTGFITITKDEYGSETLYISNTRDYTNADKLWKWNMNGLGYSDDGGETYGLAITMDGAIVADFITAGILNGNVIRAGVIQDVKKQNYWDLETGEFRLAATTKVGESTIAKTSDLHAFVTSTDVEYGNSDGETIEPTSWSTNAEWKQGEYLWTRTKLKLQDGSVAYTEARRIANGNGLGVSKVTEQYYLSTSKTIQTDGIWSEAQPEWVNGRFYWTRSKIDWADGSTTYTTPVLAQALTSGNQSTNDLDDSFTQQKVFNRLTNNGTVQGIYLSDGELYINATYIATGILTDKNHNVVFDLESGTLEMKKGSIKLGAYSETSKHYKFEVDNEGNLYAGSGTFAGSLTGADITGATGTFTGVVHASDFISSVTGKSMMSDGKFTSDYLELRGLTITNGLTTTFEVSSTGLIEINGKITMGPGSSIDWAQIDNKNLDSNPAYKAAGEAVNAAGEAAEKASLAWSRADEAYWNMCDEANVFAVLTNRGTKFGIFSDSENNKLYINANYIKAGTIDASIISLSGDYGGFQQGRGFDGTRETAGALMYGSGDPYFIVTNAGCRMQGQTADFWVANIVHSSEEIMVDSDCRLKNSISFDLDKYDSFFLSLKPALFRYNKGSSGRMHLGFIAQDVEQALVNAGLTANELAALVKQPIEEVRDDDIEDYRYGLRYGEFIALNTHMIQRLYRIVDQLIQEKGGSR